ncbi:MAG: 30S ribosomal protein S5 [Nanoarchaeota archaeon]|nr:30S ribosomal protein S5 [Nanoarchaeota archaeon]
MEDIVTPKEEKIESNVPRGVSRERSFDIESWTPATRLGKEVKSEKITNIDEILDKGLNILEAEIVDTLLKNLKSDLLLVGQSKGKFGGGKRSIWRQTQKKTKEGNKASFSALAVVGNGDGYVGLGIGKSKETVPAREKATRQAKLNIIKIRRGCGSWETAEPNPTSIPFAVEGKCGSVKIKLMPAPQGTGLVVEKECRKILSMAGIEDIYSKTSGHTGTKLNLLTACFNALKQLSSMKIQQKHEKQLGMISGSRL